MTRYIATDTEFDFSPAPGRILQRELDARSISQAQLAARTGLSTKHINLVIKGSAPLSADVAVTLEEILGTSAETWLQLEAAHQAQAARSDRRKALSGFTEWAARFPRSLLSDRGVIDANETDTEIAAKLLAFFSVASPTAYAKTWLEPQASYKRSQLHTIDPDLTAVWLRLSELQALPIAARAPAYDAKKLRSVASELPKLTVSEVGVAFKHAQEALLGAGVVLVFVPEIQSTRISGVSRWVNGTPMIAVTSRYRSLDGLWFTILHEVAHVLLHPKRSTYIDLGSLANDDQDSQETAANGFAQACLIPEQYQSQLVDARSPEAIRSLAETLGVAPSLVAGQWAFRTGTWNGPIAKLRSRIDLAEALVMNP
jgi:HTH-type transcriptional regulator/antitoxin HigA